MHQEPVYSTVDLVRDIWSYLRFYKWKFFGATVSRAIGDVAWLYPSYALASIVTFFGSYAAGMSLQPIYTAFVLMLVSTVVRYAGLYLAKINCFQISERVALDAELRVMRHLFLLDIAWHETENAGNKLKRVDRGATGLDKILRMWINNFIEIGINFVGIVFIITKFDKTIGLSVVFFLVTFYLLSRFYQKRGVAASNEVNLVEEDLSGLLFESINNIRSVKVLSMAEKITKTISMVIGNLFQKIKRRIFWFQTGNSVRHFFAHMFRLAVMAFIVWGVILGRYEIGFLVLFASYFTDIWQSIAELVDVSQDFTVAKYGVARMQSILRTPVAIDTEEGKKVFPRDWQKISIKNLSFSYGEKPVLDDVSFEVRKGERVGIVGLSGAGKSTLFKLLLKEHESYSGGLYFDGVPLKDISKKDYFNHIAVVLQDTELFNASLRDNIRITNVKEEDNQKLLDVALEIAHVRDFMSKLPKGLDSLIGEKGVKLSGGEKQRVGIARAVFKNPQILLLDEATSHLDIESEEKIKDSLHQFFQNVTAIVIAHRLTTIKEMDKIIVMEKGRICEVGSFDDLYKKKGRFYELWEKQKL
ncbi:MAG: ABC transporter ATP-binding protein [bacterium]|nr:ABC transporter ATP-binding protein [bacterium]